MATKTVEAYTPFCLPSNERALKNRETCHTRWRRGDAGINSGSVEKPWLHLPYHDNRDARTKSAAVRKFPRFLATACQGPREDTHFCCWGYDTRCVEEHARFTIVCSTGRYSRGIRTYSRDDTAGQLSVVAKGT